MDFYEHFREAILNIYLAKIRSFLAILGVVVGTGSVVALISSSQLATMNALVQFKSLGTNLLALSLQDNPGATQNNQTAQLQLSDIAKLERSSPQIIEAAPYTQLYQTFVFHGKSFQGQIIGATGAFGRIAKIYIDRGRFVSVVDKNSFYCVLGAKLAQQISDMGIDPLYKQIQVGKNFFTVVGIAKTWTPNVFLFIDMDDGLVVPIATTFIMSSDTHINDVLFRLVQKPNLAVAQDKLKTKLQQILPNKQPSFRNPQQIIDIVAKQRKTFAWLLTSIGGISLIVGGIGVMNIMLVSVVERRREIGIRMAIGARPSDILSMFLMESIILTTLGGIVGIFFGLLVSFSIALVTRWSYHLYLTPPILGFVVSVFVGILSGYYPAQRASLLDPIQTLQAE